jgi:hypothetical protein
MRRLLVLLSLVVAVVGCIPAKSPDMTSMNTVLAARQRSAAAPGGGAEAYHYAAALLDAFDEGVLVRAPRPDLVDEAASALERAAQVQAGDAPMLLAIKGALLARSGRVDEGLKELDRSMKLQPNEPAAVAFLVWFDAHGELDKIPPLCKKTLPFLDEDAKYRLLCNCLKHEHAATVAGGLAWATPADRALYARRQAAEQQAAIDQANAEAQRQAAEAQRENAADVCISTCKQRGHYCLAQGDGTERANQQCEDLYQSCLDGCDAQSRQ